MTPSTRDHLRAAWSTALAVLSFALGVGGYLLALGLALGRCVPPPDQHDPATYGVLRVALGPSLDGNWDWNADQRRELREALTLLAHVGPAVEVVPEGGEDRNGTWVTPDVVVRDADLGRGGAGRYLPGTAYVEVDAAQARGFPELRSRALHEVLHYWLDTRYHYRGHVCRRTGESPDCDPDIYGEAVMNPSTTLETDDDGRSFTEVWTGDYPNDAPTEADLRLVARLQTARR